MNGLKQLRDVQMLTQEQIAAKSGISVATISRIENGKVIPTYKTLRALAEALELPAERVREAILSKQASFLWQRVLRFEGRSGR